MAEEFHSGVCGGNWWMSTSRSPFPGTTSPCSMALNDTGGYAWSDLVDMKGGRSSVACDEETNSVSDHNSMVFQDVQKPQQADSASGSSSILIDSTLQMMGFGFSSSSTTSSDWNQAANLLRGSGRAESNYNSMLQEDMNSRLNYQEERGVDSSQIQKNWNPKNFSSGGDQDLSITAAFKSINHQDFSLDTESSSGNCTVTCQGLSAGFPVGSSTSSYGYPSTVLQSLFDHPDSQPQQSLFNNQSMNYSSAANFGTNTNDHQLLPSWPKFSPSMPKQQPWGLHFSNKTHFWNASTAALSDNARAGIFPSSQPQYLLQPTFEEKPKCSNLTTKTNIDDVQDSASVVKKSNSEPVFKRPRIETPSPLPTFKVRKEKLGDRITALQQLVSPFGKTDTASVLHEAIEYIKFLHDQVLSTPYMKNGTQIQHQQGSEKLQQDTEGAKQDLRSRGLCLVPISSTYPVANETTADFWTPTFGGTFR
ncbi:transcription factor bHLH112 isoform X2 [Corylus avellana]|uniref:transcription factor bHLH112 isoform X2 n=1 Tax=Corylus avellana TaxID=13451 RepID=UPI00286C1071|nr:transcription factor bHLH112 isoform X2 [Corylus avellana]